MNNVSTTTNNPPKPARKIVVVLIIIGCLALGFLLLWKFGKINISNIAPGQNGDIISGKMPQGDSKDKVTKGIGPEGGEITVTTGSGRTARLIIPAGAVKGKRNISLTPVTGGNSGGNNNSRNNNSGGNNNSSGNNNNEETSYEPGVIIGPEDLQFETPAWVNFSWNAPSVELTNTGNQAGVNTGYEQIDISSIIPPQVKEIDPDLSVLKPYKEKEKFEEMSTRPRVAGSVAVHTDHTGKVTVTPFFSGADGSGGGPVNGGGAIQPSSPTGNEADKLLQNAAAKSGGKCSEEFLLAASVMLSQSVTLEERSSYANTIRDCLNIEWLKNLCQTDKSKLRRAYFAQRLPLARQFDSKTANELQRLMEDCVAQYEINSSKGNEHWEGNFTMNANLCGYLDDEWSAKFKFYMIFAQNSVRHDFDGKGTFFLPYTGGEIIPGKGSGTHTAMAGGRMLTTKIKGIPIMGSFDLRKNNVTLGMYNNYIRGTIPITITPGECVDQHSEPSLEGLPSK